MVHTQYYQHCHGIYCLQYSSSLSNLALESKTHHYSIKEWSHDTEDSIYHQGFHDCLIFEVNERECCIEKLNHGKKISMEMQPVKLGHLTCMLQNNAPDSMSSRKILIIGETL